MPSMGRRIKAAVRPAAYRIFGSLPPRVRRSIVGLASPSYTVGALAVLHDGPLAADDGEPAPGRVLFVRQLHRTGLALPGGLLKRGEPPHRALARELAEEVGVIGLALRSAPDTAHVDPGKKRVDLIWFVRVDRNALLVAPGSEVVSFEWRTTDAEGLTPQTREILIGVAAAMPAA